MNNVNTVLMSFINLLATANVIIFLGIFKLIIKKSDRISVASQNSFTII